MILLTIFGLIILLIIMLRVHNGLFLYPSIIISSIFSISLLVLSMSISDWAVEIGQTTLALIFIGILSVALGEIFYKSFSQKIIASRSRKLIVRKIITYTADWRTVIIQSICLLIMLIYIIYKVQSLSAGYANVNADGVDEAIQGARDAIISDNASIGVVGSIFNAIAQGLFFGYSYIFISNVINGKSYKRNLIYLLPVALFVMFAFYSTTRTVFAMMIIYIVSVFVLLTYRKYISNKKAMKKVNRKLLKPIALSIIVFIAMFTVIGSIRGSVQQYASPIDSLRSYIASPIVALNEGIRGSGINRTSVTFGECTLGSLMEKIRGLVNGCKAGFVQYDNTPSVDEFAYTNVYTGVYPFVRDYGLTGLVISMLLIGFIYSAVISKAFYGRRSAMWVVAYSILLYAPVMFIFDDQFTELPVNITIWVSFLLCLLLLSRSRDPTIPSARKKVVA